MAEPHPITRDAGTGVRVVGKLRLVVVGGPDAGSAVELDREPVVVGSTAGCDLELSDPTVSRQHARLERKSNGVKVKDLGSRNGTTFDGCRITEAVVPLGATLCFGDTRLRIEPSSPERPQLAPGLSELHGLWGESPPMRELIEKLERAARTEATVLLTGETGTGKEVAARALHACSGAKGAFVTLDCGATAPTLLTSALFGHVKGAFTDALQSHDGAAVRADDGTLFLDEIGELPLEVQPLLLRLLESREVTPVGGNRPRRVSIKVVAATHRDLEQDVQHGRFREDLFYRLAVVRLRLPALRERLDDVPGLARRLLQRRSKAGAFSDAALESLKGYAWPGNVRELENALVRALTLEESSVLDHVEPRGEPPSEVPAAPPLDFHVAKEQMMRRFEREYLVHLLAHSERNVSQAAREAGVARAHLYRLLKKHALV